MPGKEFGCVYVYFKPGRAAIKLGNTANPERRQEEWEQCDPDIVWFLDPVWTTDAEELGKF